MTAIRAIDLPTDPAEAVRLQERLAPRVETCAPPGFAPRTATGLDVAYAPRTDRGSDTGSDIESDIAVAAAVTVELDSGRETEQATAVGAARFPYVTGLFAFRELPVLLGALDALGQPVELLVADGHGIAHPRRFGLASHLGVVTGLPAIGVAKTPPGEFEPPGPERGATSPLPLDGEQVGVALRTRAGAKPVFVSVGHRIDLASACRFVLALANSFRLPEPTRLADQRCRRALRDLRNEA
ncbi:endonuclease V [Actinophytocola sp.]|uniref:endonuclease V n=1 Tax=Actinophytocola sp. TaxID=1872138 RepID=UPI003D6AA3F1